MFQSRAGLGTVFTLLAMCISAAPVDRIANRIDHASFNPHCGTFEIRVAGSGVDQSKPIIGYNIKLTPQSGEALIITDSFPVVPDGNGEFHKTFRNSWKAFGFKLREKYSLSGSAVLVSGLTPLSTVTIRFSPATLDCRKEPE
ncbi:MAG TPA: hypothetical protein VJQ54_19990 [Candidatus Sulfotelmatobacter sp.]|nr:hypothetical protein [Candidatus Sulfotelmatobacter sp.]